MMIELEGTQEYTNDDWTDMIHIYNFILAFKKVQETRLRTTPAKFYFILLQCDMTPGN